MQLSQIPYCGGGEVRIVLGVFRIPQFNYCDIEGYEGTNPTIIHSDPLFVDVSDPSPLKWDLHLQSSSPCIDAGNNNAPGLPTTDFEGDPRVVDGDNNGVSVVDIGADEFLLKTVVAGDINGDGNVDLSDAILALKLMAGLEPVSTVYKNADVNGDGRIGMEECIYILQIVSGVRPFSIQSSAFAHSAPIPSKYTCSGTDVSPPLSWQFVPGGTKSFVLIMDDPDAPGGTWDHWIVYNIPASITSLSEDAGASGGGNLPSEAIHGTNSWNNTYYQGPCPPSGTHRYFFKLYSLSVSQLTPSGTSKAEIEAAMAGNILGQTELMGTCTYTP